MAVHRNTICGELRTWTHRQRSRIHSRIVHLGCPSRYTRTINVNARKLVVRQNCWYVLWQVRWHGVTSHLWIDSICINQLVDSEKSFQVSMMGSIYKNAPRANVGIGPHQTDSAFLFHCCQQNADSKFYMQRHTEHASEESEQPLSIQDEMRRSSRPWNPISGFQPLVDKRDSSKADLWFVALPRRRREQFAKAFRLLTERPYFSRVWIIQEVCVAVKATVFCSVSSLEFKNLMYCWEDHNLGHRSTLWMKQEQRQIHRTFTAKADVQQTALYLMPSNTSTAPKPPKKGV